MNGHHITVSTALIRSCVLVAGLTLAGAGCRTTTTYAHVSGEVSPPSSDGCVLQPGDEIDVKFYYAPELNELAQPVRPDGKISLQLIGEVQVAGQTPGSLEKMLKDKYHGLIDKTEITVIARKFLNRVVYVGGAVLRPQAVPMAGQMTVLAAIMAAGGQDMQSAAMCEVLVLRMNGTSYKGYVLDLERELCGQDPHPFFLIPGDTVYVTRSRIADVDRWVDQHINQLWPNIGITGLHQAGPNLLGVDMRR